MCFLKVTVAKIINTFSVTHVSFLFWIYKLLVLMSYLIQVEECDILLNITVIAVPLFTKLCTSFL